MMMKQHVATSVQRIKWVKIAGTTSSDSFESIAATNSPADHRSFVRDRSRRFRPVP
jgi:hypothetical protein